LVTVLWYLDLKRAPEPAFNRIELNPSSLNKPLLLLVDFDSYTVAVSCKGNLVELDTTRHPMISIVVVLDSVHHTLLPIQQVIETKHTSHVTPSVWMSALVQARTLGSPPRRYSRRSKSTVDQDA
jgi:hypothetical protein